MKKSLVLTLFATGCLMTPSAHATTLDEETGTTAQGRTASGYTSKGNFNTSTATISESEAQTSIPANIAPASGTPPEMNVFGTSLKAVPGTCYGKVTIPAVKKTNTEQVLVEPAGQKISKIIPAKYDTVSETVTVKEASEKLVTIPATYKTITETVVVAPASTKKIRVPAEYETVSERVMVKAARTYWKAGEGANQRIDAETGDVMCLVEEPAVYKNISKRVLVSPETTREETIPAVTKNITKKVVDQPARVERQEIPAVTKQVSTRVLTTPEQVVYEDIAPKYRTVNQEVIVSPEKITWSPILCQENTDRATVAEIQGALKQAGYNPGNVDGVLGSQTYSAVSRFQRDNNLHRGQITMETIKALGLSS